MSDELKDILEASDRYKKFTLPDKPACFKDMFKGRDFDAVQLHSTQIIDTEDGKKDIVGFYGIFRWTDGKIYSLDGDIYYDDFKVIGFEEFQNIPMGVNTGIDILFVEKTVNISEFLRKIKNK